NFTERLVANAENTNRVSYEPAVVVFPGAGPTESRTSPLRLDKHPGSKKLITNPIKTPSDFIFLPMFMLLLHPEGKILNGF
ncbi:MAG: hypothetical protein KBH45_15250, partial [Verrucomicrobia bacterium]|nr:hypothetical protein [Verrucomicrobiota bacterium]